MRLPKRAPSPTPEIRDPIKNRRRRPLVKSGDRRDARCEQQDATAATESWQWEGPEPAATSRARRSERARRGAPRRSGGTDSMSRTSRQSRGTFSTDGTSGDSLLSKTVFVTSAWLWRRYAISLQSAAPDLTFDNLRPDLRGISPRLFFRCCARAFPEFRIAGFWDTSGERFGAAETSDSHQLTIERAFALMRLFKVSHAKIRIFSSNIFCAYSEFIYFSFFFFSENSRKEDRHSSLIFQFQHPAF